VRSEGGRPAQLASWDGGQLCLLDDMTDYLVNRANLAETTKHVSDDAAC
jgi:hypothetical protein